MRKKIKLRFSLDKQINSHLANKFLLIIMVILLIQTAHDLFLHEIAMQESAAIAVVIRTTTAAIFGYFISVNFHRSNKDILKNSNTNPLHIESSFDISLLPKASIEFNADIVAQELYNGYTNSDSIDESKPDDNGQIIIVALIGIIFLIFSLIACNYATINITSVATLTQLRVFIFGSVGFLIGNSNQTK